MATALYSPPGRSRHLIGGTVRLGRIAGALWLAFIGWFLLSAAAAELR